MPRRIISTRTHAIIDYLTGPALVAAPSLLGIGDARVASLAPRLAGSGATAYSLLTDYELGAVKALPMRAHLALDAMSGGLLAAAPWLSGDAHRGPRYWLPHALVGAGEVAASLMTKTEPPARRTLLGRRRRR